MAIKDTLRTLNTGTNGLKATEEERLLAAQDLKSDVFDPERPFVHSNINEA